MGAGGTPSARASAPTPASHHRREALHPGAWWLWALALGTAATRTTNPLLLALLVTVSAYVVITRRPHAPWSRSYGAF
ncbi:energy-coupling factor transporter transmembrane protein EcfT, partial [Streptomyces sp. NPDC059906]